MSYDKHYSKWSEFISESNKDTSEDRKPTAQVSAPISKRQQTPNQRKQERSAKALVNNIVKELATQPLKESARDLKTSKLQEVDEKEMVALQPFLDKLAEEGTSILPFADIFGDKMRIVVPYESTGFTEEGKELQKTLSYMGFSIKEGGIIERPVKKTIPARVGKDGEEIPSREVESKERYKIGKFLSKLHAVVERYREIEHVRAELTKKNKEKRERTDNLSNHPADEIDDWLDAPETAEEKKFRQAVRAIRQIAGSIQNPYNNSWSEYYVDPAKGVKKIERLQTLWQQKAGDIIGAYKLVISRHPIDVFRMSDFKNIQSCHSPVSIGADDAGGSYWQCAVAEAYGEGAIAYVVADKDLAALTGVDAKAEAGEFEASLQGGEIFADEFLSTGERTGADGVGAWHYGDVKLMNPVSRIRIRLARWMDHREDNPEPVDIMVPEKTVYGGASNNLSTALDTWVKSVQGNVNEKILASASDKDFIWLEAFTFFGGNYSDSDREELLKTYLNSVSGSEFEYEGHVNMNTDAEDEITSSGRLNRNHGDLNDIDDMAKWYGENSEGLRFSYLESTGQNKYILVCHMILTFENAQDNHDGDLYFNGGASVKGGNAPHSPRVFFRVAKGRVQDYVNDASLGLVSMREVEQPWFEGSQVRVEMVFDGRKNMTTHDILSEGLDDFVEEMRTLQKDTNLKDYVRRNLMLGGALNGGEFLDFVTNPPEALIDGIWKEEVHIANAYPEGYVEFTAKIDLSSLTLGNLSSEDIMQAASSKDFATAVDKVMVRSVSRFRDEVIPPLGIEATVYNDGKSVELAMMFDHQSPDNLVNAIVLAQSVIFHKDTISQVIEEASVTLLGNSGNKKSIQEASRVVGSWKKFLKG